MSKDVQIGPFLLRFYEKWRDFPPRWGIWPPKNSSQYDPQQIKAFLDQEGVPDVRIVSTRHGKMVVVDPEFPEDRLHSLLMKLHQDEGATITPLEELDGLNEFFPEPGAIGLRPELRKPEIIFPTDLPLAKLEEEVFQALQDHQTDEVLLALANRPR